MQRKKRNWSWINFSTVWMGMVHNIVAYETAGSLLGLGMSVWQALGTVIVANIVLIMAMWLNGVAGAKIRIAVSCISESCIWL
ncbi:hypothetical protein GCM10020331_015450 [Ectobacillus funiculus]